MAVRRCGDGLAAEDCEAISRFRRNGGGLLITRDHMDLGSSVCSLAGIGKAHHFHSQNLDPDADMRKIDDIYTTYISWPNFHSGANGDFQAITIEGPVHPVLADPSSPTGAIRYLPSHPHEGAVTAPEDENARVIARGISKVSGRAFNIAVAFEPGASGGPAVAQSTFHHFADYNWDSRAGAPSFVDEPPGDGMAREPNALADTQRYVRNTALWLAKRLESEPKPYHALSPGVQPNNSRISFYRRSLAERERKGRREISSQLLPRQTVEEVPMKVPSDSPATID